MGFHVFYFPALANFYDYLVFVRRKVDGKHVPGEFQLLLFQVEERL